MSTTIIRQPILARVYDQPLYTTAKYDPINGQKGSANYITFFTGLERGDSIITNFHGNGCLPAGQLFRLNRIGLFASEDTNPADFQRIIQSANLTLDRGSCPALDLPASQVAWANIKEINNLLFSIRKLPQAQQEIILRNLRAIEGHSIVKPIEMAQLESFRVRLFLEKQPKIKRPVYITCILGGKLLKSLY